MVSPCCYPPMLRALVVLLSLATSEADLDLLSGRVSNWSPSERVQKCPVHSNIQPLAADRADGGKGVAFVVKETWEQGKRFALIESDTPAGSLQGFDGLQINYTTSQLGSWTLKLYDGQTNMRFIHTFGKADGVQSATLPWTSFRGQFCRRRKSTVPPGYSIQSSRISKFEIYIPESGPAQLTIQGMHAMRDLSAMVADLSDSSERTGIVSRDDDMAAVMEYFEGPFVGMGITGHNDFAPTAVSGPVDCAEECAKTSGCVSFDYGAQGQVTGECWLSLADRKLAGHAYEAWPLYNYYELKMEPAVSPAPSVAKAEVKMEPAVSPAPSTSKAKVTGTGMDTPTEAKKQASSSFERPSLGGEGASSARFSSMPVACVQAAVALALFLAQ